MSREDFIKGYCERSGIEWVELSKFRDAVPCDCGEYMCEGWQMKSLRSIAEDAAPQPQEQS